MPQESPADSGPSSTVDGGFIRQRAAGWAAERYNRVVIKSPSLKSPKLLRQGLRITRFQQRWEHIKQDLPPQFSRRHIGMISIGGIIGTGLFLGSGAALKHGGPVGALLGYTFVGTVVYCLCVSVGEMIAFLPNVGGIVGLANLYVDRAFGFSLGWASWYNWSVTLPAEIAAAAVIVQFWDKKQYINPAYWSGLFLALATIINCLPSGVYGEIEFWFSTIKILTIVVLIITCLILDVGAGDAGFVGLSNWGNHPFGSNYLGVEGPLGRFLGFWAVLIQASFSFFGSEVPAIAAGEVRNATRNVPRVLQRVWIRIMIFYVTSVFCAGLLVPSNDERLVNKAKDARSSPFVIALDIAGIRILPHIVNAIVLLSAWSAAAADIYISSRSLFFLARSHHAPQFFASILRYPPLSPEDRDEERKRISREAEDQEIVESDDDSDGDVGHLPRIRVTRDSFSNFPNSFGSNGMADFMEQPPVEMGAKLLTPNSTSPASFQSSARSSMSEISETINHTNESTAPIVPSDLPSVFELGDPKKEIPGDGDLMYKKHERSGVHVTVTEVPRDADGANSHVDSSTTGERGSNDGNAGAGAGDEEQGRLRGRRKKLRFVIPLRAVLMSTSVGSLCFLGSSSKNSAETAFSWLVAVASVASLQAWAGFLFTYIRWHQGTTYAEKKYGPQVSYDAHAREVMSQIKRIRRNRHPGQPYLAWYAFAGCLIILFTNGWAVFVHHGWRIVNIPGVEEVSYASQDVNPISSFLSSYVPLPVFFLLTFGYKLIHRTKMVKLEDMTFERKNIPLDLDEEDPSPQNKRGWLLRWLALI